ncbi:NAD-dependent epimerase/dehydratase family protein [Streptomyces sp. RKND-216]|uniref:AMP-binding protein n=1 Tax=Streptomyces sp. RKND-216 TaxID=2562581 RepID=UPI00109DF0D8|nr:AMP-binding protein [Streptomyces sp. RKND-216]THA24789.1 NAD-dependent epimerase/dehydratase family protein [Streptomyces sp. RKND-216]
MLFRHGGFNWFSKSKKDVFPVDLPELVAHHLTRHGAMTALESGARTWSYADLDEATRDRATQLRRLSPDGGRVVVVGEHTADALVWALAVMRSGLVYTPLNPGLPAERMCEAVRLAAPDAVICCTQDSLDALREGGAATCVLGTDDVARAAAAAPAADAADAVPLVWPAQEIAYSIFTSGSTGRPKLVNVGHAGIENLCRAQTRLFGVKPGHRMLQFSSLSFDASVAEILVAVHAGARLVVPAWDGGSWLSAVGRHLQANACDIMTVPPSVYARFDDEARKAIGTVVFAGEALSEVEFRAAARYSRVLNAYGPTEGTVCFSVAEPSRFTASIGRPIDGCSARIHDPGSNTYSEAGRGELVLLGAGVALGYEGVSGDGPGPFTTVEGTPAYHTGDEVELRDGEVYYLGRLDEQVKRLGHRIGMTELGGWLAQLTGASVALVADGTSLVMAHTATDRSEEELRSWLRELLPAWEMPDVLLGLTELPVTDSGKADKAALRALARRAQEEGAGGPSDAPEPGDDGEVVRTVVKNVLGTEIEPTVSIFDAGADSLALVRIQVELSEIYGEDPVQAVFDLLNYDFTIEGFLTGLRGRPGAESSPERQVLDTVATELAGLPAALAALRPARPTGTARPDAFTVTGAGGFIGGHVLDRLLDDGRRVTVVTTSDPRQLVTRHCARFERTPEDLAGIEFLGYDDLEAIARGGSGTGSGRWGAVIHCGYEVNHLLPLERQLSGSVATTGTLVRAAAARDASRFVFLSAASAGPRFVPLTEDALAAVGDPYSQSKFVAEAYVGALESEHCGVDVLRAGLVYGHNAREGEFLDRDVFAQLLRLSLRHGAAPRLEGLVPVCHVSDVVDDLLAAAGSDSAGTRSVLVYRTYDRHQLLTELGLDTDSLVSPEEWLSTVTESGAADVRILAALRQQLGAAAGWATSVGATDRQIIRELRQTYLGA